MVPPSRRARQVRRRIAIVGGGVSGLIAARTLHAGHDITVYEAADAPGGHARTVTVPGGLAVDTGFIVFNERTYPRFAELLRELGVPSQPGDMSFGVSCRRCGIEYSSRGLAGLFARRAQILRPAVHRMAIDVLRFNAWGRRAAARPGDDETIGDLLTAGRFGRDFFRHYLLPMSSAIWSAGADDAHRLPLRFLLTFFANHGLLQVRGQPRWRTVTGGSRRYVEALVRPFRERLRLRAAVGRIRRHAGGARQDAGIGMHPISLYYCHDAGGALAAVVAEVDNTFGERHLYLLDGRRAAAGSATARFRCTREMRVSPFLAMDCTYDFELARSATA